MESSAVYFALTLARVGTFVAIMPLFATRAPRVVKLGLALGLTAFYFSVVVPAGNLPRAEGSLPWPVYASAILREAAIGATMGFAFALFLMPVKVAGAFVSQQIGLSLSPQSSGVTADPSGSSLALFFETTAALVFLAVDGHHVVLSALHASFASFPLGGELHPEPLGPAINGLSRAHEMGVLLAAPLAACLFSLTVVLALLARAAPQLNIYSIGFALQVATALIGALLLLPDFVRLMALIVAHTGDMVPAFLE